MKIGKNTRSHGMKKPGKTLIAIAVAGGVLSAGAYLNARTANSRAAAEIKSVEQYWLLEEEDPMALQTILADDFIHVLPTGIVTKREQLDYLQTRKTPPSNVARKFDRLDVRLYGNTAIANGIVTAVHRGGDVERTAFTDVFVKRNGKWWAVNAQENRMLEKSDGQ
jgi:Domain of unknown function (DUF4440)